MEDFVYNSYSSRVIFGAANRLPEEIEHLGIKRAVVLATAQQQAAADDAYPR